MEDPPGEIAQRKADHLRMAAQGDIASHRAAGWDDVVLVHDALPDTDATDVDLTTTFLGRTLRLPLLISGMTGGHPQAREINRVLATVAARRGLAMGVGSQRAALHDPSLAPTYEVVRDAAPKAFVVANIGISQLIAQDDRPALGPGDIQKIVHMVGADALAVHLNYLEETVQPEGQTRARGAARALGRAIRSSPVPVIVKETGSGISREVGARLRRLGAAAIDVGGLGGTSFAAVEAARAREQGDEMHARLGEQFRDWGIPTAVCVVGVANRRTPVIASGGVRGGLDAAKALALGATVVGVGRGLLQAALSGESAAEEWVDRFEMELRTAVFLVGLRNVGELRRARAVILGDVRLWLEDLGYRLPARTVPRRR